MSKPLFIYGAGGLGREIKAMISGLSDWTLEGFYDDAESHQSQCEGIPIVGGLNELLKIGSYRDVILAFGDPLLKLRISDVLKQNEFIRFPIISHPSALLLNPSTIRLSEGCIISAGAILTTNIFLGKHTFINLNATIGHDSVIGEACSIMPGANLAGGVKLGKGVLIGSGASLLTNVTVGDKARIGAGAVVTKNVSANSTMIGVPARELNGI